MNRHLHRTITAPLYVERDGEEIELQVNGSVTPGQRARIHGPPEKCCPEMPPEAEVESVWFEGQPWTGKLTEAETDDAYDRLFDAAADADEAAHGDRD